MRSIRESPAGSRCNGDRQEAFDAETFAIMRGIHFLALRRQTGHDLQYSRTWTSLNPARIWQTRPSPLPRRDCVLERNKGKRASNLPKTNPGPKIRPVLHRRALFPALELTHNDGPPFFRTNRSGLGPSGWTRTDAGGVAKSNKVESTSSRNAGRGKAGYVQYGGYALTSRKRKAEADKATGR